MRGAVVGLLLIGVMTNKREGEFGEREAQSVLHSAERTHSWLSSLHVVRISDAEDLPKRVSCCTTSKALTKEEKGMVEIRENHL